MMSSNIFKSLARSGTFAILVGLSLAQPTFAAPLLTVSNLGANGGGNLEWRVEITPDAALFTNTDLGLGSTIAAELALEVHGSDLVGVTVNATDWPLDIAGNNPFTASVTAGVNLDLDNDTAFVSLLSDFFTAANPVEVLVVETSGTGCTTLVWGDHTVLGDTPDEYQSSLIAQAGQNFTGYQGSLTEPDVGGDFDVDCDVDGADFIEWQQGFSTRYMAADLVDWETNYGAKAPLQAITAAIPEPSSFAHLLVWLLAIICSPSVQRG